jgi:hypothetical protein
MEGKTKQSVLRRGRNIRRKESEGSVGDGACVESRIRLRKVLRHRILRYVQHNVLCREGAEGDENKNEKVVSGVE